MGSHKITPEKRDFIKDYLANHAERGLLTPELIEEYREAHKNRAKTGRRRRAMITISLLKHKNNPFCNICDEDFRPWDDVYFFVVYSMCIYHVDCFDKTRPRKQLSIIYQDRSYREKHPPKPLKKELTWWEIADIELKKRFQPSNN